MGNNNLKSPPIESSAKSINRSLSIATIIMMGSVLLSRIAGLIREQVLAHYGGTSFQMDAYVTAFLIPELLNHFLAGGFLSITFIPIFQKHLLEGDNDRAWKSFSNLLTIGSLFFIILIPIVLIFTPAVLGLMGKYSSDPQSLSLTSRLTRIILPAQIFFYWGAFFSAVQMAKHKFFLPALAPLCYNLGIIFGGILLGPFIGIEGFAWGVLIGAFIGNVIIQLPGAFKAGMHFVPLIRFTDSDLIVYIRKTIPLILGIGMVFSNEIFFRFFSSYLPDGATSSINYALRTTMIVVAVFGQASGVAFFPFLSKMAVEKQFDKMSEMLHSMLIKIAIYLLPLSAIMLILSNQIISILFQHGQFNAVSVSNTAAIFSVYLFGTFSFSAAMIIARTFYALQNTFLPMVISTGISLISIPLYVFLSRLMGPKGIALAAIIGMSLQFLILYSVWCNTFKLWKKSLSFAYQFLKICIICAIGSTVGFILKGIVQDFVFFDSPLLQNSALSLIVSIPVLMIIFSIYELSGIQSIKKTLRGLIKR